MTELIDGLLPEPTTIRTAREVIDALRKRYDPQAYAFLEQVANGTGRYQTRWADAIVMSLWPSRGLELIGIEVKVSRADWLNELRTPEKADAVARYCDRWYIATGSKEIVRPDELPATWGLLVPNSSGDMRVAKEAPKRDATPMDREFLAGILRQTAKGTHDARAIKQARDEGYAAGYKAAGGWEGQHLSKIDRNGRKITRLLEQQLREVRDYVERIEQAGGES